MHDKALVEVDVKVNSAEIADVSLKDSMLSNKDAKIFFINEWVPIIKALLGEKDFLHIKCVKNVTFAGALTFFFSITNDKSVSSHLLLIHHSLP